MTYGGVAASDNDSKAAAGGHTHVWNGGRSRYTGLLGAASLNLKFYGLDDMPVADGLRFNLEGAGTYHQAKFRLGDSSFFGGAQYGFLAAEVTFDAAPGVPVALGHQKNAGITLFAQFDTRDNTFTPNDGTRAQFQAGRYDDALGGDFDYDTAGAVVNHYWPVASGRLIVGLRGEYDYAGEDAPFYALPWVNLRGIPALRYLGRHAVTAEVEPRYRIGTRWSALAFAGAGRAAISTSRLGDAERAYNYGAGFRYLMSRALGLGVGLDVASGPEESTVYLIFGSAWGGFL